MFRTLSKITKIATVSAFGVALLYSQTARAEEVYYTLESTTDSNKVVLNQFLSGYVLPPNSLHPNSGSNFFHNIPSLVSSLINGLNPYSPTFSEIPPNQSATLYGFIYNANWGWISLSCTGDAGDMSNLGIECDFPHETTITADATGTIATLSGQAVNPYIGYIYFSDPGGNIIPPNNQVRFNFETGTFSGYGYNDKVGYIYFDGGLNETELGEEVEVVEEVYNECGNGELEPFGKDNIENTNDDEECDEGAANNERGLCTNYCKNAVCNDGFQAPNEQCDDGGYTGPNDLCSSACKSTLPNGVLPLCPDGSVNQDIEACDDGNFNNEDGCTENCQLTSTPGNCEVEYGEQCDDCNDNPNDGCDGTNDTDDLAICGNNIEEVVNGQRETCDDGNTISGDGCSSQCQEEKDFCGDGELQPNGVDRRPNTADDEICDDGNRNDNDACTNQCKLGGVSICGDGQETHSEECDDGNGINGDGCNIMCKNELTTTIDEPCVSITNCTEAVEYLSEISNQSFNAATYCPTATGCGDGFLQRGEECDDGNSFNNDGCSATCDDEQAGTICGNYILEGDEQCDDGNNTAGDGCGEYCSIEDQVICMSNNCQDSIETISSVFNISGLSANQFCEEFRMCGNGRRDSGEACDYNDTSDPRRLQCTALCRYEVRGWCGNGTREAGEQCEDGNLRNGDGCSSTCRKETQTQCNLDGVWSVGESCDSSFADMGRYIPSGFECEGCRIKRTGTTCGNSSQEFGEECDAGASNGTAGSTCSATCEQIETQVELTCLPELKTERIFDSSFGDRHRVLARMNCEEEIPEAASYNIGFGNIANYAEDTLDCNQIDSTPDSCVSFTRTNPQITSTNQNDWILVGYIDSPAPTGYTSASDGSNEYIFKGGDLSISNQSTVLFEEAVETEAVLEFSPKVESISFQVSPNTNPKIWQQFFNFLAGQELTFNNIFKRYSAINSNLFTADITLTVDPGSENAKFVFDSNGDNAYDDTDGSTFIFTGTPNGIGLSAPSQLLTAQIIPDAATPYNESAEVIINYAFTNGTTTRNVSYLADQLPDEESLVIRNQQIQIQGPVGSDKKIGTGNVITLIGASKESTKRKNLIKALNKIFPQTQDNKSSTITFRPNGTIVGSSNDYIRKEIDGVNFYKTNGDVEIDYLSVTQGVIIEGGNLFINSDITGDTFLQAVVLKDKYGNGGNVYIHPSVTDLNAHIFADGSLLAYDGLTTDGSNTWDHLFTINEINNQFSYRGSLTSNNTIGGAEDQNSGASYRGYSGDGSITTDIYNAKKYDLNYFRTYGLKPGRTDDIGNPEDCNDNDYLEIYQSDFNSPTCNTGDSNSSDLNPLAAKSSTLEDDEHYPVYMYFMPPPKTSPLFTTMRSQ